MAADHESQPMPSAKKRKRSDDDGGRRSHGHGKTHGGEQPASTAAAAAVAAGPDAADDAEYMHPDRTSRMRPAAAKKPKHDSRPGDAAAAAAAAAAVAAPRKAKSKKDKKDKKDKKKKAAAAAGDADQDLDLDLGLNRAIARMDHHQLAAHLARQTKRLGRDLSAVELADLAVGAAAIADTSAISFGDDEDGDTPRSLANLPAFLEAACARDGGRTYLSSAPRPNGAPHTLVVTGAGLRAADLVRALRGFQSKTSTVAKMFAKHIKIAEQVAFLHSHRTGIAVGTPARLLDLLDQGALSAAHLRRLVVDASHIDLKKRGVLDMQDTALPLARFLARPEFKARYARDDDGGSAEGSAPPLQILFY